MKNKAPIIILFLFAIAAMVLYLFKDKIKAFFEPKKDTEPASTPTTEPTNTGTNTTTTNTVYVNSGNDNLDKNKVLKKGSKGSEVQQLQLMMNNALKIKKYKTLTVDGAFGTNTTNALYMLTKTYQTTLTKFYVEMVKALAYGTK